MFYTVYEALVTETKVISASYFTDSAGSHNLVELEYEDFGSITTTILREDYGAFKMRFEMQTGIKYYTTDVRDAVKMAVKGYKNMALKHNMKQSMETYYHKYYDEYPELFI
jgi:hypothetical protein